MDKNKVIAAATKFVQKGQFDKAIREYQRIIEEDPRDIRVLLKIGELHQKRGDNKEAAATLLRVADAYSSDGFFLKAAAVFKQVLKLNPALIDVNLKLAELYQQLGLMNDAMQQYQLVASSYEKAGNGQASLNLLKMLVELDPDNVANRVRLAEAYSNHGMTQEGVAQLGHVAHQLKQSGRSDEFVKVAERLLFLDATNLELTRDLARTYLSHGDTKRALAKLQICFKANRQDIETLVLLAQAFHDLGQPAKTVSVYKELAKVYATNGRRDEELATWNRVLVLVPDDAEALAATGQEPPSHEVTPFESAVEDPEATVASGVSPSASKSPASRPPDLGNDIQKLLTETDVYLKYKLNAKALEHLQRILSIAPQNPVAHQKLKDLHLAMGNIQEAALELVTCIQLAISTGDQAQAKVFLEQLAKADPQNSEIPGLTSLLGPVTDLPVLDDAAAVLVDEEPESRALEIVSDSPELLADDQELVDDDEIGGPSPDFSDDELVQEEAASEEQVADDGLIDEQSEMDHAALAAAGVEAAIERSDAIGAHSVEVAVEEPPAFEEEPVDEPTQATMLPASVREALETRDEEAPVAEAPEPEIETAPPLEDELSELAEIEFFIEQGLLDDASEVLANVKGFTSIGPVSRAKLAELEERLARAQANASAGTGDGDVSFDLGSELAEEVEKAGPSVAGDDFQYSVEDVLTDFKKQLETVLTPEDVDAHYEMGIAYKEMGLVDEAISEFETALRGAAGKPKEVDCLSMISACFATKGRTDQALSALARALEAPLLEPEARLNLDFEIGSLKEGAGDFAGALEAYEKVAAVDSTYRQVDAALKRLKKKAPDAAGGGSESNAEQARLGR